MDEGTADIGKEGWSKVIFKPLNSHYECLRLYETIARSISWMEEGVKVSVKPHKRHQGVFFAKGKEDVLCTKNFFPGEAVNNEKIFSVENEDGTKVEYRVWNPFCSMLAAAILAGVKDIHIKPGARVLYLGAGSGTTVSHVSDIVGPNGLVYAVESSLTSGRDLVNMAKKRTNVIPIIQDAKFPGRYTMLVGKVDVMCSEFAEPDGASILALNALYFLRDGGSFVMSVKESCGVSRDHEHNVLWATSKLRPKMNLSLWSILGVHDSCTFGYYGRNPKEEYWVGHSCSCSGS